MAFSIDIDIIRGGKPTPTALWTSYDSRRVGNVILSLILKKTLEGKDALYQPFKPYASPKTAQGRKHPDLYDTGRMLNSLRVVRPTRSGFTIEVTNTQASQYGPAVNAVREFMGWAPRDNPRINRRIDKIIDSHLKAMSATPALGGI